MKLPSTLNLAQAMFWIANMLGGYLDTEAISEVLQKLPVESPGSEPSLFLSMMRFQRLDPGDVRTETRFVLGQEREAQVRGGGAAEHWSEAEKQLLDKLQAGALMMKGRKDGAAGDSIAPIPADDFQQIRFGQAEDGNPRASFRTKPDRFWDMLRLSSDAVAELWPIGAVVAATDAQPQSSTKGQGRTDAKLRAVMQALQHLHPEPPLSRDLKGNLTSVASILGSKVSMSTLRRAWDTLWPK